MVRGLKQESRILLVPQNNVEKEILRLMEGTYYGLYTHLPIKHVLQEGLGDSSFTETFGNILATQTEWYQGQSAACPQDKQNAREPWSIITQQHLFVVSILS